MIRNNDVERFMSKVEKLDHGCWKWCGSYFKKQYGDRPQFWMKGTARIAARCAWVLFRGPIPEDSMICHVVPCSHEWCVNPDHLYPGDQDSNMADRDAAGRTSKWDKRYNFVQTPELDEKVKALRIGGERIEDICAKLNIGRTTYYRLRQRGVVA